MEKPYLIKAKFRILNSGQNGHFPGGEPALGSLYLSRAPVKTCPGLEHPRESPLSSSPRQPDHGKATSRAPGSAPSSSSHKATCREWVLNSNTSSEEKQHHPSIDSEAEKSDSNDNFNGPNSHVTCAASTLFNPVSASLSTETSPLIFRWLF